MKEFPLLKFKSSKITFDILLSIELTKYEIKIKYGKMWYTIDM